MLRDSSRTIYHQPTLIITGSLLEAVELSDRGRPEVIVRRLEDRTGSVPRGNS
jgi:hypothetical protein